PISVVLVSISFPAARSPTKAAGKISPSTGTSELPPTQIHFQLSSWQNFPRLIKSSNRQSSRTTAATTSTQSEAMKKTLIHLLALGLISFSAALFAGCENTGEGVGEDLQDAGQGIQDAAEDAQN